MWREKENSLRAQTKPELHQDLSSLYCPGCLHQGYLEHYEDPPETDSEGTFENHYIRCRLCKRRSLAMDTEEAALEAFLRDPENCTYLEGTLIVCKGNDIYDSFVVEPNV